MGLDKGIKTGFRIKKAVDLPLDEETKKEIIKAIIKRDKNKKVKVYSWKRDSKVISEVFFSKKEAIKNWYITEKIWEQEGSEKNKILWIWEAELFPLLQYIKKAKIQNVPVEMLKECGIEIEQALPGLTEDIKRTLKKQQ